MFGLTKKWSGKRVDYDSRERVGIQVDSDIHPQEHCKYIGDKYIILAWY